MKRIAEDIKLEKAPITALCKIFILPVLKRAGVPIEMISEQLGYTSIKITQIYLDGFKNIKKRNNKIPDVV